MARDIFLSSEEATKSWVSEEPRATKLALLTEGWVSGQIRAQQFCDSPDMVERVFLCEQNEAKASVRAILRIKNMWLHFGSIQQTHFLQKKKQRACLCAS